MKNEIKRSLFKLLESRLERIGISPDELGDAFDLVKSGLVNSLEFVDIVTTLEREFECEIDFDSALEKGDMMTIGGLVKTIDKSING